MDYAIEQMREYLEDVINCADQDSTVILVFYWEHQFTQARKAFNRRLRRKAAAKNFTLKLSLRR